MGKSISIQPIKGQVNKVVKHQSPRRQANKVLNQKGPRGNIHNSFRKGHKDKSEHIRELRELKQQMYNRLWGTEESAPKSQLDLIG